MPKYNFKGYHDAGQTAESKGSNSRPYSAFERSVISLFDGDYSLREGASKAHEAGRRNTRDQKNSSKR